MYIGWQVLQSRRVVLFSMLWLSLAAIILPVFFLVMTHGLPKKKGTKLSRLAKPLMPNMKKRTKLLDWIETQHKNKLAQENFTYYTNYAYKLHNRKYQYELLTVPSKPNFSVFYQPSALQNQGKLIFVGTGAFSLRYDALPFCQQISTGKTRKFAAFQLINDFCHFYSCFHHFFEKIFSCISSSAMFQRLSISIFSHLQYNMDVKLLKASAPSKSSLPW